MITIYEIAKLAHCSPSTVSKALNNSDEVSIAKKQEIVKIATQHKYIPNQNAKALSTKINKLIGIIYNEELGLGLAHHFYSRVIECFRRHAGTNGYDIIFINNESMTQNRRMSYLEHCRYRQVDGLYIPTFFSEENKEVSELLESNIPIVMSDESPKDIDIVISDDEQGATIAVEYLRSLNHRLIYHLAGPYQEKFASAAAFHRYNAYSLCMKKYNLPFENNIFMAGDFSFQSGYDTMKKILNTTPLPTAVFASSDILALGAIQATKEHGLMVPEDISFVGFDDIDILQFTNPSLTTIRQNKDKLGEFAATRLIEIIEANHGVSTEISTTTGTTTGATRDSMTNSSINTANSHPRIKSTQCNTPQIIKLAVEIVVRDSCKKIEVHKSL